MKHSFSQRQSVTIIHIKKHLNQQEALLQSITRQFLPVGAFGPSMSQSDREGHLQSPLLLPTGGFQHNTYPQGLAAQVADPWAY